MVTTAMKLFDPKLFDSFSVGFDRMFKDLNMQLDSVKSAGFPPYNIKKVADNKYVIEMAVAGFSKTDIELTLDNGKLIVSGSTKNQEEDNSFYFWKGIAERAFTRSFSLADTVEIKNAEMVNGILKIFLENFIPEDKKPKKIDIKD
jgi:molecular chaperone IbpA